MQSALRPGPVGVCPRRSGARRARRRRCRPSSGRRLGSGLRLGLGLGSGAVVTVRVGVGVSGRAEEEVGRLPQGLGVLEPALVPLLLATGVCGDDAGWRVAGGAVRRRGPIKPCAPVPPAAAAAHLAAPHHTHTLHPLRAVLAASARWASHAAQQDAALLCLARVKVRVGVGVRVR
eukprot:scaffold22713_cov39-Phaeocystis_antarctica.AAC.1